jgi:quinol monooxygenase YgiN
MAITRINQFEAKASREDDLYTFLKSIISVVETCPGCIAVKLLRSTENPGLFAIIEDWESVEAHRSATGKIPPEKLAEASALFAKPPSGAYYKA